MTVRFLVRMVLASAIAAGAALVFRAAVLSVWELGDGKLQAVALLLGIGAVDLVALLLLARVMRIRRSTRS